MVVYNVTENRLPLLSRRSIEAARTPPVSFTRVASNISRENCVLWAKSSDAIDRASADDYVAFGFISRRLNIRDMHHRHTLVQFDLSFAYSTHIASKNCQL
jgi:hypothetical protein